MKKKAFFLDRDGVITKMVNGDAPKRLQDLSLIREIIPVIKEAHSKEYINIIISNQPDVAQGHISEKKRRALETRLKELLKNHELSVDAIYYCHHHPEGAIKKYAIDCNCRKPKPGMLLRAAKKFNIDLKKSYFIGDRASDVKAGKDAGVRTILFDPQHRQKLYLREHNFKPDYTINKLGETLNII